MQHLRYLLVLLLVINTCTTYSQISFMPYEVIPTGSWPEVVCIGDVNHDGLNDVVLGTSHYFDPAHDDKIFVFLQNILGNLNPAVLYPYPSTAEGVTSIDIADVNNDDHQEVIIGYGDSIGIFFQDTAGGLLPVKAYYSGFRVKGLKAGDLNNDHRNDIAVCHWAENYIRVFYQVDTGFVSDTLYNPSDFWMEMDIADLNDDGLNDAACISGRNINGPLHVFLQNNAGHLNPYDEYFSLSTIHNYGFALGDINSDGRDDVVVANCANMPLGRLIAWIQDTISNTLDPPNFYAAYDVPEPVVIADLNCDGKNEVIAGHGGWPNISVYEQDSMGFLTYFQLFPTKPHAGHYTPYGLCVGDINSDGKKDVVLANYNYGLVTIINNSVPESYTETQNLVTLDTVFSGNQQLTTHFIHVHYDTISNYLITTTDTFQVMLGYYTDSIRVDSMKINLTHYCSATLADTIFTTSFIINQVLLSADTIFLSGHLDSTSLFQDINIYPNPSSGQVTIELPSPFDDTRTELKIYNDRGKLVYSEAFSTRLNKRQLNLNHKAQGYYLLKFIHPLSIKTKKIIIER